jgi:hypothetical protein
VTDELAHAGGPVGCLGLALLLVAVDRRLRLAGLAAWALGVLALAAHLVPSGDRARLVAAGAGAVVLALVLAALVRRRPWLLALAALACAPIRIPVSVGNTDAKLLVPLYVVVAAAVLVLAWELVRGEGGARELGPIAWPLAAFVGWAGLTLAWTQDLDQGAIALLFFYLPFGLLAVALARLPWREAPVRVLYGQLALMGAAFAAVGIYQWVAEDVFWNRKLIVANAYSPLYRVNSIFYDPSIYGRFCVLAIVASLVVILRGARPRVAWAATAAIAITWLGLLFSFSQSSFIALGAGVVAAAALAWRWRQTAAAVALAGAVALALALAPVAGAADATGGRVKLVTNGLELGVENPLGVGIGGFKRAYAEKVGLRGREPRSAASHTTPVTVFAETGFPGLALFAWLAVVVLAVPLRCAFRPGVAGAAAAVAGVSLVALGVHSLGYNALFEDPLFWGFAALAAVLHRLPSAQGARA